MGAGGVNCRCRGCDRAAAKGAGRSRLAQRTGGSVCFRDPRRLSGADWTSSRHCNIDANDPEQKSATSKVSSVDRSLKVGGRHRVAVIVATVLERVRRPARLASDKGS
jgi:hypothetical protein